MVVMKLTEYFLKYGYDTVDAVELISEYQEGFPPSERHFPKNAHVAAIYMDKKKAGLASLAGVVNALVEKIFTPIYLSGLDYQYINKLFGYFPNSKENAMKCYLFSQAATYKLMQAGNCSFRASYAAIFLANRFSR